MKTDSLIRCVVLCAGSTIALCGVALGQEGGFVPIFDGKTLAGWHASAKTGHSAASGNRSGGKWVVEDGAITGSQDIPGNGGIVLTDEQFGDFEVALEMNNDFGPDSGLFLRSTEDGKAYQAMIDYHSGGNLMGVYGEGLGGKPSITSFSFLEKVTEIKLNRAPVPCPVLPQSWPFFWRHGQWNELRARIVNDPPTITTWINGVKWMEWTEAERRHPAKGSIGLQVHGGGDLTQQHVRYRNIRVRKLDGASALTAVADPRLFEMRTYYAAPGKLDSLQERFRNHTTTLFAKHGMQNVGYWVPVQNPDRKLVYVLAYPSREAREESWKAFGNDPDWQKVVKESEAEGRLVEKVEVVYLKATEYSPAIQPSVATQQRVFELRTYKCGPGMLPHLNARFRDDTTRLFAKHGLEQISYWTPIEAKDGAEDTLIYFLAHENRAAAAKHFKSFAEDPAWVAARKASEDKAGGSLTVPNGVKSEYMVATDYSPIR